MVAAGLTTFPKVTVTLEGRRLIRGRKTTRRSGGDVVEATDFQTAKSDALMSALVAINLAIVRHLARESSDPEEDLTRMRSTALQLLAGSAEALAPPADLVARQLVETVFLQ